MLECVECLLSSTATYFIHISGESTHDSCTSSGSATSSVFYERRKDLGDGSSGPSSVARALESPVRSAFADICRRVRQPTFLLKLSHTCNSLLTE